jgi:hypothetical protein
MCFSRLGGSKVNPNIFGFKKYQNDIFFIYIVTLTYLINSGYTSNQKK